MIARSPISTLDGSHPGMARPDRPERKARDGAVAAPRHRRLGRVDGRSADPVRSLSTGRGRAPHARADGPESEHVRRVHPSTADAEPSAGCRGGTAPSLRPPLAISLESAGSGTAPRRDGARSPTPLLRTRLEELLSLALAHQGWTARQLAAALGRSSGSVVPESGLPKIDLLIRLAGILGWPLETIMAHLSEALPEPRLASGATPATEPEGDDDAPASSAPSDADWWATTHVRAGQRLTRPDSMELLRAGQAALSGGDPSLGLRCALTCAERAQETHHRTMALALEAECWSALGLWDRAIPPLQDAVASTAADVEPAGDRPSPTRTELLTRLARAYHRTGLWLESGALAGAALEAADRGDARTLASRAEALSLRVLCLRDGLELTGSVTASALDRALEAARECLGILGWPAVAALHPQAACIRLMTEAAVLELDVHRGQRSAGAAVARVLEGLEPWVDVEAVTDLAGLAGAGWWSVLGFAIAVRHLRGTARQQTLAILSNKADEIATAVGCSALRERVLRMEFDRRERAAADGDGTGEWVLDEDDLRAVVRCIGASRRFRPVGMEMLRHATLVLSGGR